MLQQRGRLLLRKTLASSAGYNQLAINVVVVFRTGQSTLCATLIVPRRHVVPTCERRAGAGELVRTWDLSVLQAPAPARW